MNVVEVKDKQIWDNFVASQPNHSFLHSWAWGEFNKSIGDEVLRLGVYEKDNLSAVMLVIKVNARRGNFLFVPHGPVFSGSEPKPIVLNEFVKYLKRIAKEYENIAFIRISPIVEETEENKKMFKEIGFRDAPIYMHAETTWTLPLKNEEEEIMMGMRKNTRNLIRRAKKEGIEVESGKDSVFLDNFIKLYEETAKKHSFVPFSKKYIDCEVSTFSDDENGDAKIYLAKYKQEYIASAIVVFWGHSAYYHHGASSSQYSKLPSSYLLQWEAIQDAKKEGKKLYNFWGIAKDDKDKKNPWYGLTLFKKGFGGNRTDYVHAQDLPMSKKYWLNYAIEKYRLWKRGV